MHDSDLVHTIDSRVMYNDNCYTKGGELPIYVMDHYGMFYIFMVNITQKKLNCEGESIILRKSTGTALSKVDCVWCFRVTVPFKRKRLKRNFKMHVTKRKENKQIFFPYESCRSYCKPENKV